MAKLIYSMLISLDGYTEDEHGQFGWGVAPGGNQHDHSVNAMSLQRSRGDWTAIELFLAGSRALALESPIIRMRTEKRRA